MTIPHDARRGARDPARLRARRRPARRLRRDGLHARRAAARLARPAPGDQPLLCLRACRSSGSRRPRSSTPASTCTSASACASRPTRSIRRSRTTTGSTSCCRCSTPTTAAPTRAASSTRTATSPKARASTSSSSTDGVVRTPERGVLEGISRRTVIELCGVARHPAARRAGSGRRSGPRRRGVPQLDRRRRAADREGRRPRAGAASSPGPITQRLHDAYWALHDDPRYRDPVAY